MGYSTDFRGQIDFDKPLTIKQAAQIEDFCGERHDEAGLPGIWCDWEVNEDGDALRWSGAEKFYNYVEWLKYLIDKFFKPWGIILNGEIHWQGEEPEDAGVIYCKDNVVEAVKSEIHNPGPSWSR